MYEVAVDVLLCTETERSSHVLVQIFEEAMQCTQVLNVILFINHSQKQKSTNSL